MQFEHADAATRVLLAQLGITEDDRGMQVVSALTWAMLAHIAAHGSIDREQLLNYASWAQGITE